MTSKKHTTKTSHLILKSAVIVYLFAFITKFMVLGEFSLLIIAAIVATIIGVSTTIIMLNYKDFLRFGFIPVIIIALFEIEKNLTSQSLMQSLEAFYYLSMILISIYFMLRGKNRTSKKKK